jgi:sucrose synthase
VQPPPSVALNCYASLQAADIMADFFDHCAADPSFWERISRAGLDRIYSRYTWDIYARRLLTLSSVYGFWKHVRCAVK